MQQLKTQQRSIFPFLLVCRVGQCSMESMATDILLGSIGVSVLTMLIIYSLNERLGELAFRLRGSFHWYIYIPLGAISCQILKKGVNHWYMVQECFRYFPRPSKSWTSPNLSSTCGSLLQFVDFLFRCLVTDVSWFSHTVHSFLCYIYSMSYGCWLHV